MTFRPIALATALLAVAATTGSAQQLVGTMSMRTTVAIPDSLAKALPGGAGGPMAFNMTVATDGKQFSLDLAINGSGAMAMLAGMHVRAVYSPGSDTLHAALLMPDMTGSGTPTGYKLDLPVSAFAGLSGTMDSMMKGVMDTVMKTASKMPVPVTVSLGTKSTVAGIDCENWRSIAPGDTTSFCVAPMSDGFKQLRDQITRAAGLEKIMDQMTGMSAAGLKPFGGRDMIMLKMANSKTGTSMEVTQLSSARPDAAQFTLPANLMPAPFAMPTGSSGSKK
jgi:hypothetical protein